MTVFGRYDMNSPMIPGQKSIGKKIQLRIKEIKRPETNAKLVAENIGRQIKARASYRRACKMAIMNSMKTGIQGIKGITPVYEPKGYLFDYVTPDEISTNLAGHLDESTRLVWIEASQALFARLNQITFADLLASSKGSSADLCSPGS